MAADGAGMLDGMKTTTRQAPAKPSKVGSWRRDFAGLEERRLEAAPMFAHGASQAEVARTLGVSPRRPAPGIGAGTRAARRRWGGGPGRTAPAPVGGGAGGGGRGAGQGTSSVRVRQRAVDPWPRRSGDRAAHRGPLPPGLPASATRRRSPAGAPRNGPGSRGGAERRRLALVPGGVRGVAAPAGAA